MKKIGIITFHRAINYGAVLQMYALYTTLKKNNNDVKIIDYVNKGIKAEYSTLSKNKSFKSNFKDLAKNTLFFKRINRKRKKFKKFLDSNFVFTKQFKITDDMENLDKSFDAFITGSDQVWNPNITNGIDDTYFLKFCNKARKISYAASFGSLNVLKNDFNTFIKKLESFDKISVREKGIADYINANSKLRVKNTLDPTLLLSREDWEKVIPKNYNNNKKYILLYSVGNKKEAQKELCNKVARILSKRENLDIIDYSLMTSKSMVNSYTDDPFEFLSAIKNAEYIVASSFHGAVFSIIFNKKMWIAANSNTGIRVYNLMENFGLSNRILKEDINYDDLFKNIDFKKINEKLNIYKEDSIDWLLKSIE